jgi:hypothetical protein
MLPATSVSNSAMPRTALAAIIALLANSLLLTETVFCFTAFCIYETAVE